MQECVTKGEEGNWEYLSTIIQTVAGLLKSQIIICLCLADKLRFAHHHQNQIQHFVNL